MSAAGGAGGAGATSRGATPAFDASARTADSRNGAPTVRRPHGDRRSGLRWQRRGSRHTTLLDSSTLAFFVSCSFDAKKEEAEDQAIAGKQKGPQEYEELFSQRAALFSLQERCLEGATTGLCIVGRIQEAKIFQDFKVTFEEAKVLNCWIDTEKGFWYRR